MQNGRLTRGGRAAFGAVLLIPGLVLLILSFGTAPAAAADQRFFTAPPCAAGVKPLSNCTANLPATLTGVTHMDTAACNSPSRSGSPCWNLVFALSDGSRLAQNFDFTGYAGAVSHAPVDPPAVGIVKIWNNRLVSFSWNGNDFTSTAYPLGSSQTVALRSIGIGCTVLGGVFVLLALRGKPGAGAAANPEPLPVPQGGTARQRLDAYIAEMLRTGRQLDPDAIHQMRLLGDEARAEMGIREPEPPAR